MMILVLAMMFQAAPEKPEVNAVEFVEWMEKHTGKKFIYSKAEGLGTRVVRCRLNELDPERAYAVGLVLLKTVGLCAIRQEKAGVTEITSSNIAYKRESPVYRSEKELPEADEWCTLILRLSFVRPRTVQAALISMVTMPMNIVSSSDTPTLIITDFSSNVRRLVKLVREMDYPNEPFSSAVAAKWGPDWLIRKFGEVPVKALTEEERLRVKPLLKKLSSDSFEARADAIKGLRAIGPAARPRVSRFLDSDTVEIRTVVRDLFIEWAVEWAKQ